VSSLVEVLAQAAAQGGGALSAASLLEVFAVAALSGVGSPTVAALLEVLAQASLQGLGALTARWGIPTDGLVAWYDFSDASTVFEDTARTDAAEADDAIAGVTDKSGSGNHLVQATAGNRPIWKANIQNGLSIARFDTNDDWLERAASVITGDATIVAVVWAGGDGSTHEILPFSQRSSSSGTPIRAQLRLASSVADDIDVFADFRNDANQLTSSGSTTTDHNARWMLVTATWSGTTQTLYEGLSQLDQDTNTGGAVTTDTAYVGTRQGAYVLGGDLGEALVYNRALSADERAIVCEILRTKWDIAMKGQASLFGIGSLTASALLQVLAGAGLTGSGSVSAAALQEVLAAAAISGLGSVLVTGDIAGIIAGAAGITGAGGVAVSALDEVLAAAGLTAGASLSGASLLIVPAGVSIDAAVSALIAAGVITTVSGVTSIAAGADLTADSLLIVLSTAVLSGKASVSEVNLYRILKNYTGNDFESPMWKSGPSPKSW
jgi:hypothetical protein